MNTTPKFTADERFDILCRVMQNKARIQAALDRQEGEGFTFDHIFDLLLQGKISFFSNEKACVFMEFRTFPEGAHAHVFLAAGSLEGLIELYDVLGPMCKNMGINKATTLCRKGFRRALKKYGWEEKQVWLTKEL